MNRFSNVMRIILKPTQPDAARKIQIFRTKNGATDPNGQRCVFEAS